VSEPGGIALGGVDPGRSEDRWIRPRWRARDSGEAGRLWAQRCRSGTLLARHASTGRTAVASAPPELQALGLDSGRAVRDEVEAWVNIRFGDTGRRPEGSGAGVDVNRRWQSSIFGPETFARGSFLFALPVRAGAAASLGDVARCSAETLHHR